MRGGKLLWAKNRRAKERMITDFDNGLEMVVAVDFDNTLFETDYPKILSPKLDVIEKIKYLKERGCQIILYTCRDGEYLQDALNACKQYGLEFDAINENLKERTEFYSNDCRKIGADYYIDDKAISPDDENLIKKIIGEEN